jgi:anti-sigma factor RsiW
MSHLTPDTLQALAEDELPPEARRAAEAHAAACEECAGELEVYQALFSSLASLRRFEPTPGFADAVMARVQIAPAASLPARIAQRLLPSTRRGWTMLVGACSAPILVYTAILAWLLSNPLVSAEGLGTYALGWTRLQLTALTGRTVDALVAVGALDLGQALVRYVFTIPAAQLFVAGLVLAIATPLSLWILYRSVRTPLGGISHAAR